MFNGSIHGPPRSRGWIIHRFRAGLLLRLLRIFLHSHDRLTASRSEEHPADGSKQNQNLAGGGLSSFQFQVESVTLHG